MKRYVAWLVATGMAMFGMAAAEGVRVENEGRLTMEARRHRLQAQGTTRLVHPDFELRAEGQMVITFAATLVLKRPGENSSVSAKRQLGSIVAIGRVKLVGTNGMTFEGERLVFRAKDGQWFLDGRRIDLPWAG